MARISSIASKLTLNTAEFHSRLEGAKRSAQSWGKSIGKAAKIGGGIIAATGAAVAASSVLMVKGQLSSIDAISKQADVLGLTTEQLVGYQHAAAHAGVTNEALGTAFSKMLKNVGDARDGLTGAVSKFDALGLSVDDLSRMSPDQQFKAIADAMGGLTNQADKAKVAQDLFGRSGLDLLRVLALGTDGIDAAKKAAEQMGLTFNRVDGAKVETLNDDLHDLGQLVTGVSRRLTIELAPYIDAASKKLLSLGITGQGAGSKVVDSVEWVTKAIAKVADVTEFAKAAFYGAQSAVSFGSALMVRSIDLVGKSIESIVNLIPGVNVHFTEMTEMLSDELFRAADEAANKADKAFSAAMSGESSAKVGEFFANIRNEAQKSAEAIAATANSTADATDAMLDQIDQQTANVDKLTSSLADIQKQLDNFGKSEIDVKVIGLAELGATNEQLDQARANLERLDALKAQQERSKSIADTIAELESSVRTFGLSDADKTLLNLDSLGASDEQLSQAKSLLAKLDELNAGQGKGLAAAADRGGPSLIEAGSARAEQAAYRASRGMEQQDGEAKKQTGLLGRIASNTEEMRRTQRSSVADEDTWSL